MALQIRRGTEAERASVVFALGELVYTTNTQKLYVGDGTTLGGVDIMANMEGAVASVNGQVGVVELDTSNITENNNLYYTNNRALDAIGNNLTRLIDGNSPHSGIQFVYNGHNITASVDPGSFTGLQTVEEDTNPSLGGDLSLNTHAINGTGSISITGNIRSTGVDTSILTLNGANLTSSTGNINVGTTASRTSLNLLSNSTTSPVMTMQGIVNGLATGVGVTAKTSRTGDTIVDNGDLLYSTSVEGYNGTDYQIASLLLSVVDPNGTVDATHVPGMMGMITFTDVNQANYHGLLVNRNGYVSINRAFDYDATQALDVNGGVNATLYYANQQANGSDFTSGYTFNGTEGGHDTGMYSPADGVLKLISNTNTVITVNSNKTITLAILSAAPSSPVDGTFAIADRVTWDPASKGSGGSYPVYYNGSTWNALF
jgi:hypothetical protein